MSEEKKKTKEEIAPDASKKEKGSLKKMIEGDPVRFWAGIILGLCILLFLWHLLSDKYTPYTSNGRVEAFVVPIVPQVSGTLIKVNVINNQFVKNEAPLAEIDSSKYELAVRRAQAELQQASQTSEADVAAVTTAQARVTEAGANLRNAEVKGERIIKLSKQGAASESRADDARTRIEMNKAKLVRARSELKKAKSKLGSVGPDNARVKSALTALETAELDLHRTIIKAPGEGIITNLTIDVGHYANAGSPIMTFIATKDSWVQADMRENSLGHIKNGDPVDLILDSAPGKVFKGEVMSVGYGVSDSSTNTLGGLATVQTSQGWLREAQRFPVLIRFTDDRVRGYRRAGGQVNVVVYTGDSMILNAVAWIRIRFISFLSHIY